MRRRRSNPSSSGLLLDTLCNALGGVLFIALLVVLLVKDAPMLIPEIEVPDSTPVLEALAELPTSDSLSLQLQQLDTSLAQYKTTGLKPVPTSLSLSTLLQQRDAINLTTKTPALTKQEVQLLDSNALYRPGPEVALDAIASGAAYFTGTSPFQGLYKEEIAELLRDPDALQAFFAERHAPSPLSKLQTLPTARQKYLLRKHAEKKAAQAEAIRQVELAKAVATPRDYVGVICRNNEVYITPNVTPSMLTNTTNSYQQTKHYLMEFKEVDGQRAVVFSWNRPGLDIDSAARLLRELLETSSSIHLSFSVYPDGVEAFRSVRSGLIDLKDENHTFYWSGITGSYPYTIRMGGNFKSF